MGRSALISAAVLLVAASLGCSTTQPTAKPAQNGQVTFQANAPRVELFEVWDASLVTTNIVTHAETVVELGLWCDIAASEAQQQRLSAIYPFRYSVEIDVIRAGTSTIERVSDEIYASSYGSITAYDESPAETPSTHAVDFNKDLSDPSDPDVKITLSLANGRRISTASRDFISKRKLAPGSPNLYGSKCPAGGLSTGADLGEASVAGHPGAFPIQVNSGDTVIVKARKDTNPVTTVLFTTSPPTFGSQIHLEGKDVSSSLVGNTFSPQNSQDGISYSFTLR